MCAKEGFCVPVIFLALLMILDRRISFCTARLPHQEINNKTICLFPQVFSLCKKQNAKSLQDIFADCTLACMCVVYVPGYVSVSFLTINERVGARVPLTIHSLHLISVCVWGHMGPICQLGSTCTDFHIEH